MTRLRQAALAIAAIFVAGSLVVPSASADATAPEPFGESFFLRELAPDAPIDADSDSMVGELANLAFGLDPANENDCRATIIRPKVAWTPEELIRCEQVTYQAGINTDAYAPPVYEVSAEQARVPVILDSDYAPLAKMMLEGVPIPESAQQATGTDGQLVIYQPSSDTMWEFWRAYRDDQGIWHASWGGRMMNVSENPGYYRSHTGALANTNAPEQHNWGETATSLPNMPGLITAEELRQGEIDHALNFAILTPAVGEYVFPAQREDGKCVGDMCSSIPEGARFRLPADFDSARIQHPVVRAMAEATRDYGMVLNNRTGSGVDFYAEGWRGQRDVDPYFGPNGMMVTDQSQRWASMFMREFPWEELEMIRRGTQCSDPRQACPEPTWWESQFKDMDDPGAPVDPEDPGDPENPVDPGDDYGENQAVKLAVTAKASRSKVSIRGRFNQVVEGRAQIRVKLRGRSGRFRTRTTVPVAGRTLSRKVRVRDARRRFSRGALSVRFETDSGRKIRVRRGIRGLR